MTYATQTDLVTAFGETEVAQLSDRDNTGEINAGVVALKLADADAEVDSYLVTRYALPLPNVPPVLRRIACDLARYHLADDRVTEAISERYKNAVTFLKSLANGTTSLGPPEGGEAAPTGGLPEVATDGRTFTRDSLRGFR